MISEKTTLTLILIVSLLTLFLLGMSVSGRITNGASVNLGCVMYSLQNGYYVGLPVSACDSLAETSECDNQGNYFVISDGIEKGGSYTSAERCDLKPGILLKGLTKQ